MITRKRIAELRQLQVNGVTNDMTGLSMHEVYMPSDMDVNDLLDAAESALELRSSLVKMTAWAQDETVALKDSDAFEADVTEAVRLIGRVE